MKALKTLLALCFCLLVAPALAQQPAISFNVPDGTIVSPLSVAAWGIPGLAYPGYRIDSAIPLRQVSATGFYQSSSVWLGGNTGWAEGGLYWYTPVYPAGRYTMTVTATDTQGHTASRVLTLYLVK